MTRTYRTTRHGLPNRIVRHLEQQGLGWGHDLYPGALWIKHTPKQEET